MGMHNPLRPGEIVRRECLEPLGLTVTWAAQGLGVTRQSQLCATSPASYAFPFLAPPRNPAQFPSGRSPSAGASRGLDHDRDDGLFQHLDQFDILVARGSRVGLGSARPKSLASWLLPFTRLP